MWQFEVVKYKSSDNFDHLDAISYRWMNYTLIISRKLLILKNKAHIMLYWYWK